MSGQRKPRTLHMNPRSFSLSPGNLMHRPKPQGGSRGGNLGRLAFDEDGRYDRRTATELLDIAGAPTSQDASFASTTVLDGSSSSSSGASTPPQEAFRRLRTNLPMIRFAFDMWRSTRTSDPQGPQTAQLPLQFPQAQAVISDGSADIPLATAVLQQVRDDGGEGGSGGGGRGGGGGGWQWQNDGDRQRHTDELNRLVKEILDCMMGVISTHRLDFDEVQPDGTLRPRKDLTHREVQQLYNIVSKAVIVCFEALRTRLMPNRAEERNQLARILAAAQGDLISTIAEAWQFNGYDAIEGAATTALTHIGFNIVGDLPAIVAVLDAEREERESLAFALDAAQVKIVELVAIVNRHEQERADQDQALQQADDEAVDSDQRITQLQQIVQDINTLRQQERGIDQAQMQSLLDQIAQMHGSATVSEQTLVNLLTAFTSTLAQIQALAGQVQGSSDGGGSEIEQMRRAVLLLQQGGQQLETDLAASQQSLHDAHALITQFEDSISAKDASVQQDLECASGVINLKIQEISVLEVDLAQQRVGTAEYAE